MTSALLPACHIYVRRRCCILAGRAIIRALRCLRHHTWALLHLKEKAPRCLAGATREGVPCLFGASQGHGWRAPPPAVPANLRPSSDQRSHLAASTAESLKALATEGKAIVVTGMQGNEASDAVNIRCPANKNGSRGEQATDSARIISAGVLFLGLLTASCPTLRSYGLWTMAYYGQLDTLIGQLSWLECQPLSAIPHSRAPSLQALSPGFDIGPTTRAREERKTTDGPLLMPLAHARSPPVLHRPGDEPQAGCAQQGARGFRAIGPCPPEPLNLAIYAPRLQTPSLGQTLCLTAARPHF
ncbi:hypothetical protein VTN00DRAFT_252 [Thermoascus crustaceus]|uniref:uncharacterized protein n=1 Tax=Thermoascus crustaceus TaxID=5088 RepID=UPI003741F22A